jgi:diadenosine tetraphosphate (Ap4A) HIT family hydrolase
VRGKNASVGIQFGWQGVRDEAPATLFDKIISGEIPAAIVKQDDKILAFKDITPAAPAHILVDPQGPKWSHEYSQSPARAH